MSLHPKTKRTAISSAIPISSTGQPQVITASVFDALSDGAFIREAQLVQSPKRPNTPAPLPFSAPTLWRKVAAGTFPKPIKLSQRVTAWNVGAVRQWIAQQSATV